MIVVKPSLLPIASRWHHHYYYIQTNISVQVGALMREQFSVGGAMTLRKY